MTAASATARSSTRRVGSACFLLAVFVSAVGDEIAAIAVLVHLASDGKAYLVAALLFLQLVPMVLLSPLTGQLLDRRDAGRVLAFASFVQAVVLLIMGLWPNTSVLLMGSTAVAICAAASAPAAIVLIPLLAGEAFPSRANGLLEISRSASTLAGPVVGGVLVASAGINAALLADAASFAVAGAIILLIRVRRPVEPSGSAWWKGATDGLRFLASQPQLRAVLPVLILTVSASSMVNVAIPFFAKDSLRVGSSGLGLLISAWGAGALIGAVLSSSREWRVPERAILAGAGLMGAAIIVYGAADTLALALVAALCAGTANSYQNVAMRTAVQRRTPEMLLGRAHAAAGSVVNSFFLIGFLAGGVIVNSNPKIAILAAGTITLVASLAGYALLAAFARQKSSADYPGETHVSE